MQLQGLQQRHQPVFITHQAAVPNLADLLRNCLATFILFFLSFGPHKWQNWQSVPLSQHPLKAKAQGLHTPTWWPREPTVGNSAEPNKCLPCASLELDTQPVISSVSTVLHTLLHGFNSFGSLSKFTMSRLVKFVFSSPVDNDGMKQGVATFSKGCNLTLPLSWSMVWCRVCTQLGAVICCGSKEIVG